MSSQPAKITITPQEVAACQTGRQQNRRLGTITILNAPGRQTRRLPTLVLLVLTLVPFVNAWAWTRQSRFYTGAARRFCLAAVASLTIASCIAVFGTGIYLVLPKQDWTAAIDEAADRGVLLVAMEARDKGHRAFSVGTGFVVAVDGKRALIVTNKHVVGMADEAPLWRDSLARKCILVLRCGSKVEGMVVGWHRDPEVDLALIAAQSSGLCPLAPVGQFESIKLGDDVLAVGHPEGLMFSFSKGSVERKWQGRYIQSSVPLNQGNSGGPLLDRRGRVIGVNTMVYNPDIGAPRAFSIRADLLLEPEQWECRPDCWVLLSKVQRN